MARVAHYINIGNKLKHRCLNADGFQTKKKEQDAEIFVKLDF